MEEVGADGDFCAHVCVSGRLRVKAFCGSGAVEEAAEHAIVNQRGGACRSAFAVETTSSDIVRMQLVIGQAKHPGGDRFS